MKSPSRRSLIAVFAALCLSVVAFAGDPTGTWTWSTPGRNGGAARASTLKLALKDGALTGSMNGRNGDVAISSATFKDPDVSFSVEREFNGNKFVTKYAGKLDGDTITGKVSMTFNDQDRSFDWTAKRGAAADAAAPAPAPKS